MTSIDSFDYYLPEKLIAQKPAEQRDQSRLMVLDRTHRTVSHHRFADIEALLGPSDLLVVNNTKVFPARLLGRKETGGKAEVLLLGYPDTNNNGNSFTCECLVNTSKRPREGTVIVFDESAYGEVGKFVDGRTQITFHFKGDLDGILHRLGRMPLPPYIKRENGESLCDDRERYQTVYADKTGAVAAPTAGLHFSDGLINRLKIKGIDLAHITLHVGYGTFLPVRVKDIRRHRMHSEWYEISEDTAEKINDAKDKGKRIIAVGTTSVRALEYVADDKGRVSPGAGECDLFIYPGYQFKSVQAMITNFHLPRSTLIMLVSAFAERKFLLESYQIALQSGYRFYSYGDGMLIV